MDRASASVRASEGAAIGSGAVRGRVFSLRASMSSTDMEFMALTAEVVSDVNFSRFHPTRPCSARTDAKARYFAGRPREHRGQSRNIGWRGVRHAGFHPGLRRRSRRVCFYALSLDRSVLPRAGATIVEQGIARREPWGAPGLRFDKRRSGVKPAVCFLDAEGRRLPGEGSPEPVRRAKQAAWRRSTWQIWRR